jgi:hypothetical protein
MPELMLDTVNAVILRPLLMVFFEPLVAVDVERAPAVLEPVLDGVCGGLGGYFGIGGAYPSAEL